MCVCVCVCAYIHTVNTWVCVCNVFSHIFYGVVFLPQDMIKHSSTTDHKGKLKEYFDQLKVRTSNICHLLMHSDQRDQCLQTV